MKRRPHDIVEVLWDDAHSPSADGTWQALDAFEDAANEPLEARTVGYLIEKRRDRIVIAASQSIDSGGDISQVSGTFIIPRKMIVKMRVLSKGRR